MPRVPGAIFFTLQTAAVTIIEGGTSSTALPSPPIAASARTSTSGTATQTSGGTATQTQGGRPA